MRARPAIFGVLLLTCSGMYAQSQPSQLTIVTKELPPASLWMRYGSQNSFQVKATGGIGPYHWRVINGTLANGIKLSESGDVAGTPQESGKFQFTLDVRDSSNPPLEARTPTTLVVETPFSSEWDRKALVNGNRIDGSVKVSNRTGRDFDLTFIVLAVNDIGRATAIGYQHFPLQANARDFRLPFGDSLSPGNYAVNVDLVAEEPISGKIFRTRLVAPKATISQGP